MIAEVSLLLVAVLLATLAPRSLRRATWTERSPWVGIVLWQSLSASAVMAIVSVGAALALPAVPFSDDLAALWSACGAALRAQYATPGGAALSATGAVLALGVLGRASCCLAVDVARARAHRARHRRSLALLAGSDDGPGGTVVLDHDVAAAYCLPGRGGRVVVTSAALATLSGVEAAAVLAHERAHLDSRHHVVLAFSSALARAFPRVSLFGAAHEAQVRLVEMHADDVAASCNGRLSVATALVHLAGSSTPTAALGAGGPTSLARVRRLLAPARPLGRGRTAMALATAALLLVVPLGILVAPAAVAAAADLCPFGFPAGTV